MGFSKVTFLDKIKISLVERYKFRSTAVSDTVFLAYSTSRTLEPLAFKGTKHQTAILNNKKPTVLTPEVSVLLLNTFSKLGQLFMYNFKTL